jgi:hypothetical protein
MRDTPVRLRNAIEKMAAEGKEMTYAYDKDHTHPTLRFRLRPIRRSVDDQRRVMLENLEWGQAAALRRMRSVEEALELIPVNYIGTKVGTLAILYKHGLLRVAS